MFEVLEAKIIIFAENKQADKKFLLKELFDSETTETEIYCNVNLLYCKFCTLICNCFSHNFASIYNNIPNKEPNKTLGVSMHWELFCEIDIVVQVL